MPESKSPVLEEANQQQVEQPRYKDTEREYLAGLRRRLILARDLREKPWDEFDGMTYTQYCEANRKGALTFIKPKENDQETTYTSGTTRSKLMALLSALNNLDLAPDLQAFDQDNHEVYRIGEDMEDLIEKTAEVESDEEKKLMRQYVLLEQGTVFVQENWEVQMRKEKKSNVRAKDWDGKIDSAKWTERLVKAFEGPARSILQNESVYLGDPTQFFIAKQPFIFTVEHMSYEEAKAIYGEWERWKYVSKNEVKAAEISNDQTLYSDDWALTSLKENRVEIIKYQDKWNDEFQIIINGVIMLPVGFWMPHRYGEYNITMQVLEVIHEHFAYGKSLVARTKSDQAIIDVMLRLAILKTQQSFIPPMANNSSVALSSAVFHPGKITAGVDPNKVKPLLDAQGVNQSEFNMIDMLFRNMDQNSVDKTFAGQQPQGSPTATQIMEVQRQAEQMVGIIVFVAAMLEKKLTWLRLWNLLENYFDPVDTVADEARQVLANKYRSTTIMKHMDGVGYGKKIIRIADETPEPKRIFEEEQQLSRPDMPVRISYLNAGILQKAKYCWFVTIVPRQKRTSSLAKVLEDEFSQRARTFQNVNEEYLQERFAKAWEANPSKLFKAPAAQPAVLPGQPGAQAPSALQDRPSVKDVVGPSGSLYGQ